MSPAKKRPGRRLKGRTLSGALRACVGIPGLQEHAQKIVDALVDRHKGNTESIAAELEISDRQARRILRDYRWTVSSIAAKVASRA